MNQSVLYILQFSFEEFEINCGMFFRSKSPPPPQVFKVCHLLQLSETRNMPSHHIYNSNFSLTSLVRLYDFLKS